MNNPTDFLNHNPDLVAEIQQAAKLMERLGREGYPPAARVKIDLDVMQHVYPTLELVRLCAYLAQVWKGLEVLKQDPALKQIFDESEPACGWHLENKQAPMMVNGVRAANSLLAAYIRSAPKKGRK